jgi:hypothetical protein
VPSVRALYANLSHSIGKYLFGLFSLARLQKQEIESDKIAVPFAQPWDKNQ